VVRQAGTREDSFFAVLGAPAREKSRRHRAGRRVGPPQLHHESWQRAADARTAAAALVNVRIYTIDGVKRVKTDKHVDDAITPREAAAPTIDSSRSPRRHGLSTATHRHLVATPYLS